MERVKMTVIMPSYNNGQYMPKALDSILMQKRDFSLKIIISDDCSTDNSREIIEDYKKKHSQIITTLYSEKNQKLFSNQLKAISEMNTEYFCILDPDDYWTDELFLQKAVDFLDENTDYTIYSSNALMLYSDGTTQPYVKTLVKEVKYNFQDYLNNKAATMTTVGCIYRNVIFNNGIPEKYKELRGSIFEDSFRADAARNLMHLYMGKALFRNEIIGYYVINGMGLWTSLSDIEKNIAGAISNIGFYNYFGKKNLEFYYNKARKLYLKAVKYYNQGITDSRYIYISEKIKEKAVYINNWLAENNIEEKKGYGKAIPFDLEKFADIDNKKLIIWGTGKGSRDIIDRYRIKIKKDDFYVDSNKEKWDKEYAGSIIKSPDVIKEISDKYVLIASSYYKEIIKYIREWNLCKDEEIINIFDYIDNIR